MADLVLSCLESRVEDNRNLYARFLVGPFLKGEALTVATALRRVLLSSIESIGITALYIQGITHEFSTIVGVRESVLELSLNFQAIVLSYDKTFFQKKSFFDTIQIGYLQVQGPKVVYANHLKLPLGVKLVDPTQYIATVSKEGSIVLKFIIGKRMPSLHQNIGPESHFGNQARELPIIGEVGKKSIDRAKKTCFYKKGSTIKFQTKTFSSPGQKMIFRSNGKMYEKICNLKNKKNQFKEKSFYLPGTDKSSCKTKLALPPFLAHAHTHAHAHALWARVARRAPTRAKASEALHLVTMPSPSCACMRTSRKSTTPMPMPLPVPYGQPLPVSPSGQGLPVGHRQGHESRFVRNCNGFAKGDSMCKGIQSFALLLRSIPKVKSFVRNPNTRGYVSYYFSLRGTEPKNRYVHNERSTRKCKSTNFFTNKAKINLGKLFVKRKNGFQKSIKYKILHRNPYNSQSLSFYKTKRRFLRFVFCKSEILSFFSKVCLPIYENGLPNSSSLLKTKIIFRKRKLLFQKYKGEDKNDLKEKKFLFLSKNKIFKSNICLRNVIPLDFTLTPVLKVNFVIEIDDEVLYLRQKVRERIILEVWTNGSIHPRQALHDAALSLTDIFASFRSVYQGASYF